MSKNNNNPKRKWYKRWWAFILYFFVFIIVIASLGGDKEPESQQVPTNENQQAQETNQDVSQPQAEVQPTPKAVTETQLEPTPEPVPIPEPQEPVAKSYQQVTTFSGNGAKSSEPFTITGSRFKIAYDCQGDLCQAFLNSASDGSLEALIMNTTDPVKDETIVYGSGEYFIQANTIGSYTFTVFDYK